MEIRRKFQPGMKVRRFQDGGKGPGNPDKEGFPQETIKGTEIDTSILDSILINKHGKGDYDFSEFRNAVRSHEGGIQGYSAIQLKRKNGKQGEGRGGYQFDPASAATAYQRLKNIATENNLFVPVLTEDQLKNMDQMSPELQDLLFTAHFMDDPNSKVSTVISDKSQWADQWAKGHWKGNQEDYDKRTNSFEHSLENIIPATDGKGDINSLFPILFPPEQNTLGSTLTLPQEIYND